MRSSQSRCRVATVLIVVTLSLMTTTWAGLPTSFSGRVFQADGRAPWTGAVVTLVDPNGEPQQQSSPTRADGAFVIDPAPVGTYRLLVETTEGAFLASDPVTLAAGVNRPVALSLQPNFQQKGHGLGSAGGLSNWATWLIAGGIGVVGLLVIDEISDSESNASEF